MDNDGTDNSGYEINNTEFVAAWNLLPDSAADNATSADTKPAPAKTRPPLTGDQALLIVILALLALVLVSSPIVIRYAKESRTRDK